MHSTAFGEDVIYAKIQKNVKRHKRAVFAIAYDELGADADWSALLSVAAEECGKIEAALREVAVENEPNPAKINWGC